MDSTPQSTQATLGEELAPGRAMSIRRRFTQPGQHPFDSVEWELRDARIGHGDKIAFEQTGVEFPVSWSQNSTNIVAQKYFRGQVGSPARERSVKQMIGRVSGTIADWGRARGYFATAEDGDAFEAELTYVLLHQMAAFNSPVWFNVGFEENPQCSACFILSVDDTMDSILDWNTKEGKIFRGGSGSGINLSNIRGSMEPLSKGGTASGPVSFMRGADSWAGTIKSGGKTRRAAKMVVLDVDHPDIREFIWCKAKEEDKAAALRDAGFDMSIDGDGFTSIQYQNANNSVRVTDAFMHAVENDLEWQTTARATGEPVGEPMQARELMREIAEAAWRCADPGVQYDTTINQWHTSPQSGRINASNPCFPADARVHTTKGLMPIGELVTRGEAGEQIGVYTHRATAGENGSAGTPGDGVLATRPVAFMRNGVKSIVRLRFANGAELRCTPNHRLWTLNRGYVAAEQLTKSDRVMLNDCPTPASEAAWELPVAVGSAAKSFARGGSVVHQELPQRWSEGLAELTGHLVGDGWMTDVQTGWVYGGDDIADGLLDSHEGMLTELIGGISRQEVENGTVQLRAGSEAVRDFFRALGVTTARAPGKRVPSAVLAAPAEIQAAFLRGLFGADGCVSRVESGGKANRYVGLGSRSEALLKDVTAMLNAFGVRGRIYRIAEAREASFSYTRKDGTTVEYASREGFDLRITGSDLERFAHSIGFSTPRKEAALAAMLAETGRYRTKPGTLLLAREDDGQEEVYNLTEPAHHSYIVDGVVVANCSEYMHVDDSACNLASLNLMKFRRADGTFDVSAFEHATDVVLLAQEIVVGPSSYPTEQIAVNARAFRQLGLGYTNLGAFLMANGVPYDSDQGRGTAAAITALMTGRAYAQSAKVAAAIGPYEHYAVNREPHNNVMRMHRDASYAIPDSIVDDHALLEAARALVGGRSRAGRRLRLPQRAGDRARADRDDLVPDGLRHDRHRARLLARQVQGAGRRRHDDDRQPHGPARAARTLGYADEQIEQIEAHIAEHGTIVGAPGLKDEHLPVFDVAVGERAISPMGHIKMMGAVQPFISGAISKTVNMPNDSTVGDIEDAYVEAWRLGVKALAIYRDGSKTAQALRTDAQEGAGEGAAAGLFTQEQVDELVSEAVIAAKREAGPARKRMPRERQSLTHKFSIGGHEGYITAGMYDDGTRRRDLPDRHRQGGLDAARDDELVRDGDLDRAAVRRAARDARAEVQLHALRPRGDHPEPGDPVRQVDARLHHALARLALPGHRHPGGARHHDRRGPRPEDGGGPGDLDVLGHREPGVRAAERGRRQRRHIGPRRLGADRHAAGRPGQLSGLDLGPACGQCGGMMQRTGACYTCTSCGNNTGCG